MAIDNDILNTELNEEQSQALAQEIQNWKEATMAKLEEEYEEKLEAKINEMEELSNVWKEEVAEAYSDKFLEALNEIKEDIEAQVLAESVESDPTHKVVEEIMRLVAPLMDEEYVENTYASQIKTLKEELDTYKRKEELNEGREVLEELLEKYDDALKPAIRAIIGEGSAEEVTEKFEKVMESINQSRYNEEEDFENEFIFDEEDSDNEDFDFDEDEDADEDVNEDVEEFSSINEEFEDSGDTPRPKTLRDSMMRLI